MKIDRARKRFYSHVDKKGPYPKGKRRLKRWPEIEGVRCHLWIGANTGNGYGQFRFQEKNYLVHRFVWMLKYGSIPEGMDVLHKCDRRNCLRVEHLWLGNDQANADDMVAKHRSNHPRGSLNGRAKLTEEDIHTIRRKYKTGKYSQRKLAGRFGVAYSLIYRIVRGTQWSHV